MRFWIFVSLSVTAMETSYCSLANFISFSISFAYRALCSFESTSRIWTFRSSAERIGELFCKSVIYDLGTNFVFTPLVPARAVTERFLSNNNEASPKTSEGPILLSLSPRGAVSYTHLRAHETLMNLVCRLLLEKKNLFDSFFQNSILLGTNK